MNGLMGLDMNYLSAERVLSQYGELMSASKAKLRGNPSSLSKFFPVWQQPHVAACTVRSSASWLDARRYRELTNNCGCFASASPRTHVAFLKWPKFRVIDISRIQSRSFAVM